MQRIYRTREMQTKAKEILDAAEAGEDVRITRNGKVFKVVLADAELPKPTGALAGTGSDDLLEQLVSGQQQTNDLLRQLVEQKDTTLDDLIEQGGRGTDLDDLIGQNAPHVDEGAKATVWPRMILPDPFPKARTKGPEGPTRDELKAAYEYLGLRETVDGLEITEKGVQSALGTVKKIAREDPESAEAKVMRMGPADGDRIEFLRCVQLDKISKALAKRAAGDPRWLGVATPPRI
ncbi:type II toxin-antitoxin system Phd/YefM family antitoxin [Streptomyces sp. NPDC017966]|uniref:type II toxin-antitoxin system Phd/YefM family antitoxin n=1 Tax=Streptomyces sp. NPDC017966 TaxID=3365023 RepID=UPI0037A53EF5